MLHDEQDQEDFEKQNEDEDAESNPITNEDEDTEEQMDKLSFDDQEELPQADTVNKEDNKEVDQQLTEEVEQLQQHRRSERTRIKPAVLSCKDRGQQVDTKALQHCQTVNKIRAERKHNLFHTAERVDECSTQEAIVLGRCMGDMARRHSTELVFAQQHVLEKGLQKFGKQGKQATVKEV